MPLSSRTVSEDHQDPLRLQFLPTQPDANSWDKHSQGCLKCVLFAALQLIAIATLWTQFQSSPSTEHIEDIEPAAPLIDGRSIFPKVVCQREFSVCKVATGESFCTMSQCNNDAKCAHGEYLCPVQPGNEHRCVATVQRVWADCDGLKGTHFDPQLSDEERVAYLVRSTTLDEQIAQLVNRAPGIPRLGVPSYNYLNDDQHGVKQRKATAFPNGCALGASFSDVLVHNVGRAIGVEARATHNILPNKTGWFENGVGITLYAPNMNLVKDPRWGRAQEVFSEDPHLSARLTVAFVKGMQSEESTKPGSGRRRRMLAMACCKHFAAYNIETIPESRHVFDAHVDTRAMWETYLPVFKACVQEARAGHVMCSYNALNGKPTCANPGLLQDILRDQWGFDGFVVSDYDAWDELKSTHHYVDNYVDAAAAGINAGMDQEGGFGRYLPVRHLKQAQEQGKVHAETIARSFARVMTARMRLGMFDLPGVHPADATVSSYYKLGSSELQSPAHLGLALDAARKAMTLLKNHNNNVLPIDTHRVKRLSVIGFKANRTVLLLGNYSPELGPTNPPGIVTILQGVKEHIRRNRMDVTVTFHPGCHELECSAAQLHEAAQVARESDMTVVVLGLSGHTGCPGPGCEEEERDRAEIEFPAPQLQLVETLRGELGKTHPLVGVLVHGGSMAVRPVLDNVDALLDAWYPGQMGGQAVAEVLFGAYNPAGRSIQTWYNSSADLPPRDLMSLYPTNSTDGITYRFYRGIPVVPFGYGLSYTKFTYHGLQIREAEVGPCDTIHVQVDVVNQGPRDGDEVVQVYLKQRVVGRDGRVVPSPHIRLVAHKRVHIKTNDRVRVNLQVKPEGRVVVNANGSGEDVYRGRLVVPKGAVKLFVSGGQPSYSVTNVLRGKVAATQGGFVDECRQE